MIETMTIDTTPKMVARRPEQGERLHIFIQNASVNLVYVLEAGTEGAAGGLILKACTGAADGSGGVFEDEFCDHEIWVVAAASSDVRVRRKYYKVVEPQ